MASLGSIVDDLLAQYHCLTQHNPALADPVVLAVHDDWEELLGQIDLLLASRQSACQSSQHLQTLRDTMDEELENYAHEMYSIDQDECTVKKKAMQMQVSFACFTSMYFKDSWYGMLFFHHMYDYIYIVSNLAAQHYIFYADLCYWVNRYRDEEGCMSYRFMTTAVFMVINVKRCMFFSLQQPFSLSFFTVFFAIFSFFLFNLSS